MNGLWLTICMCMNGLWLTICMCMNGLWLTIYMCMNGLWLTIYPLKRCGCEWISAIITPPLSACIGMLACCYR
jgi:hypothetical protein